MTNEQELIKELKRDEGQRLIVYRDHLGYLTIGVGHLIDPAKGANPAPFGVDLRTGTAITSAQSEMLLYQDIKEKEAELDRRLPWWRSLSPMRQRVIMNMAFQLGVSRLLAFKKTLAMVSVGNYQSAAQEMLDSTWHRQTPARAERLAAMMVMG